MAFAAQTILSAVMAANAQGGYVNTMESGILRLPLILLLSLLVLNAIADQACTVEVKPDVSIKVTVDCNDGGCVLYQCIPGPEAGCTIISCPSPEAGGCGSLIGLP